MSYFLFRQNNSGGFFTEPAAAVFVEADTISEANERVSQHITLCGDSGLYADYDDCGCCPCCGHRWSAADAWDRMTADECLQYAQRGGLLCDNRRTYFGHTAYALIDASGDLLVADSDDKLDELLRRIGESRP